jgi:riboflavin synthase
MFTGLVTGIGTVQRVQAAGGGLDLTIACPWNDLVPGESVAIDGACLTVTTANPGAFDCHVVLTTLERTRFAEFHAGQRVNLERALRAGDRLGGHLVQGHVDGVGRVVAARAHGAAWLLDLEVPPAVASASIPLGSITVDGVSLTVNALVEPGLIQVSLIPFTLQQTTLGDRRPGDRVHLEGDTVAKYLRAMAGPAALPEAGQ